MARAVRFRKDSQTEFAKTFRYLADRHSSWQAWADFVVLAAVAIANRFGDPDDERHQRREEEYRSIMERYSAKEQEIFPELFAMTVMALEENPEQDFLGEMFMALELGNHWKGQFFTPYDICKCMAAISMADIEDRIEKQGWIGIMDCCCGAGALLIAARNRLYLANPPIGYLPAHLHALFVCQDIDRTAALMCYIQLSLLGCSGYVVVGNSLTHPTTGMSSNPVLPIEGEGQEIWCMPMFHDQVWVYRQAMAKLDGLMALGVKEPVSEAVREMPVTEPDLPALPANLHDDVRKAPVTDEKKPAEPEDDLLTVTATGQLSFF